MSIIIPAYNESPTILSILEKVIDVELLNGMAKELVIVDDYSSDDTVNKIKSYLNNYTDVDARIHHQKYNQGKGAAIREGIELATGDFIIIQDADLEYDPEEYNRLLKPAIEGVADVVYGSRFIGGHPHRILFFWHSIGNKFLTFISNVFSGLNLTDMETCYKLFRSEIIKSIKLKEKRFGFEPEVTAKIARIPGIRIYEVGISYYGRTFYEGKKIGWKDGLRAIWCVFKYNTWSK